MSRTIRQTYTVEAVYEVEDDIAAELIALFHRVRAEDNIEGVAGFTAVKAAAMKLDADASDDEIVKVMIAEKTGVIMKSLVPTVYPEGFMRTRSVHYIETPEIIEPAADVVPVVIDKRGDK